MIRMKKYIAFFLAVALCCGIVAVIPEKDTVSYADIPMTATPTDQYITIDNTRSVNKNVPIYTITQANGYGSNYIRLRDVCYYLDMDVVWNAENPNAMYIYTHRHYLDSWDAAGPATAVKTAVASNMEIYINDEKVTSDSQPVLIENNNYFKVRDLAKLLDVGCVYGAANPTKGYVSAVRLDSDYPYTDNEVNVDEQGIPQGQFGIATYLREKYPDSKREEKVYESSVWYGGDSGTLSDTPVTYSARDSWGKEDYWSKYAYCAGVDPETKTAVNAIVQLFLDSDIITSDTSGINGSNPYYRYPQSKNGSGGTTPNISVNLYGFTCNYEDLTFLHDEATLQDKANKYIRPVQITSKYSDQTLPNANVEAVRQLAADVIAEAKKLPTMREQVTYLAHAVCDRLTYSGSPEDRSLAAAGIDTPAYQDTDGVIWANRDTIYSAVCGGYNSAFSALSIAAGFSTATYGIVTEENANHVRSYVWLADEEKVVSVDCTWADGSSYYQLSDSYDDEWICFDDFGELNEFELFQDNVFYNSARNLANNIKNRDTNALKSRTIILDANGGTFADGSTTQTVEYTEGYFYNPHVAVTKENSTLVAWVWKNNPADSSENWHIAAEAATIPSDNIVLHAVWRTVKSKTGATTEYETVFPN